MMFLTAVSHPATDLDMKQGIYKAQQLLLRWMDVADIVLSSYEQPLAALGACFAANTHSGAHERSRKGKWAERKQAIDAQETQEMVQRPPGAPQDTAASQQVILDEYIPPTKDLFIQDVP
ncbi:hypothetical protein BDY21DRAFT_423988 [Lineolata rhizophorae]|uniref:Uncharacterized protein n=1 Tax=Lineolata rhizophorae TaxID=578093 RepID=A0A6A6NQV0_9PEZI|nr:hypothetical protein BDY21DRAFT_423988 [Lineolata rhizophorae]